MDSSGDNQKRRFGYAKSEASLPDPTGPNLQEGDEIYTQSDDKLFKLVQPAIGPRIWRCVTLCARP